MEYYKSIIDCITSFCFLVGTIWTGIKLIAFFDYKYDADIRSLYIDNCKKVQSVVRRVISKLDADFEDVRELQSLKQDALIFLHADVVEYLDKICYSMIDLATNKRNLETFYEPANVKNQILDIRTKALNDIRKLDKQSCTIYRKHIVKDNFNFKKLTKNKKAL